MFKSGQTRSTALHPFVLSFIMVFLYLHWLAAENERVQSEQTDEEQETRWKRKRDTGCEGEKEKIGHLTKTDRWDKGS